MRFHLHIAALAATIAASTPVMADTTLYSFSGLYSIAGGTQAYTGVFSIVDPALTPDRPPQAPDMTQPNMAAVWAGSSDFYTGGADVQITFASGTRLTASQFGIVVNNTTFSGQGSPYPLGLSVQLYPSGINLTAPTGDVCATPTGACGPDDDPLYHDATQAAIMTTTGIYFAFYSAPASTAPGMPNLVSAFSLGNGGLGVYSVQNGLSTTTLTSFNGFTSAVTSVPEPASGWLLAAGLACIAAFRLRATRPTRLTSPRASTPA
jgi:hypothetical protein